MDAVLDEDGLDLGLQLSCWTQNSDAVAVRIERRVLPRVDAHHHPVVLRGGTGDGWTRLETFGDFLLYWKKKISS